MCDICLNRCLANQSRKSIWVNTVSFYYANILIISVIINEAIF